MDAIDVAMTKQVLTAMALALAVTPLGLAHAVLVEATPAINASVPGPDIAVQLRFNSRIDAARSQLSVVLPGQSVRPLPLAPQTSPETLNSRVTGLGSGTYRLRWQVLAADGHITRGEVPFQIK
jgi:methionine-rich copper-binding protein CopC